MFVQIYNTAPHGLNVTDEITKSSAQVLLSVFSHNLNAYDWFCRFLLISPK